MELDFFPIFVIG